jgi:hypothetical protein
MSVGGFRTSSHGNVAGKFRGALPLLVPKGGGGCRGEAELK